MNIHIISLSSPISTIINKLYIWVGDCHISYITQQFQPIFRLLDTEIPWYSSMSDYRKLDLGLQIHLGAWDHGNVLR